MINYKKNKKILENSFNYSKEMEHDALVAEATRQLAAYFVPSTREMTMRIANLID